MNVFSLRHQLYRNIAWSLFQLRVARLRQHRFRIELGSDTQLIGLPRLQLEKESALKIGNHCIFRSTAGSNPIGIDQPVTFCTLLATANIVIGDRVGMSGETITQSIRGNSIATGNPGVVHNLLKVPNAA